MVRRGAPGVGPIAIGPGPGLGPGGDGEEDDEEGDEDSGGGGDTETRPSGPAGGGGPGSPATGDGPPGGEDLPGDGVPDSDNTPGPGDLPGVGGFDFGLGGVGETAGDVVFERPEGEDDAVDIPGPSLGDLFGGDGTTPAGDESGDGSGGGGSETEERPNTPTGGGGPGDTAVPGGGGLPDWYLGPNPGDIPDEDDIPDENDIPGEGDFNFADERPWSDGDASEWSDLPGDDNIPGPGGFPGDGNPPGTGDMPGTGGGFDWSVEFPGPGGDDELPDGEVGLEPGGPGKPPFQEDGEEDGNEDENGYNGPTFPDPPIDPPADPDPPDPPSFRIDEFDYPDIIGVGEEYIGTITITNTGESEGAVSVVSDGLDAERTLEPGESATIEHERTMESPGPVAHPFTITNHETADVVNTTAAVTGTSPDFAIADVSFPSGVPLGEDYTGEVTVRNVGGVAGDATIETEAGSETVSLDPSASTTVSQSFTMAERQTRNHVIDLIDERTGERLEREETGVDALVPAFEITDVSAPSGVPAGDSTTADITTENTGGTPGDVTIESDAGTETLTLVPGESATVSQSFAVPREGALSATVRAVNEQTDETDDERDLSVESLTPAFEITDVAHPEEAAVGDQFTADITTENTGGAAGDVTIESDAGSETVSLGPGEATTVTQEFGVPDDSAVNTSVTAINEWSGERADREAISVESLAPEFVLGEVSFPEAVREGGSASVDIPVRNDGDAEGTAVVEVNEFSEEVTIPPGGSREVSYTISGDAPGKQEFEPRLINARTGEVVSQSVERVGLAEPDFTIRNVELPGVAEPGENVTGEVTVANDGDAPGDVNITAGATSEVLTLAPGEEQTLSFGVSKTTDSTQAVGVSARDMAADVVDTTRQLTLQLPENVAPPEEPSTPPEQPPGGGDDGGQSLPSPPFDADGGFQLPDPLGLFGG